jgi:tetratricopeptide (TPR) repeat protein
MQRIFPDRKPRAALVRLLLLAAIVLVSGCAAAVPLEKGSGRDETRTSPSKSGSTPSPAQGPAREKQKTYPPKSPSTPPKEQGSAQEEEGRRELLLADSRYHLQDIPPEWPAQKAASFRVAAEGYWAWKQGRNPEAEDRLERALSLDPKNPFGYFYLAEIRLGEEDYSQALIFLNQAELLFQGHPYWLGEVYTNKGRCHEALRNAEAAARAYSRALEYNPWNEASREGLARVGPSQG